MDFPGSTERKRCGRGLSGCLANGDKKEARIQTVCERLRNALPRAQGHIWRTLSLRAGKLSLARAPQVLARGASHGDAA